MARKLLARSGFVHEEVSNWAKPPYFAKHNRRYWLQQHYLALGLGAHGFLPINGELGWRFHHGQSLRAYTEGLTIQPVKLAEESRREVGEKSSLALLEKILSRWQVKGETRSPDDWLLEALGSGIRCQYGVSLREIQTKSGQVFKPTPFLTEQLAAGNTLYQKNGRLLLDPSEWFRETAWCLEILKGFGPE